MSEQIKHEESGDNMQVDVSWIHDMSLNVSGMTEANAVMEETMSMVDESWIQNISFNISGMTEANAVMEETMLVMDDFRGMSEADNDKSLIENQICEFIDTSICTSPPSSNARKLAPQIYMSEWNDTSSRYYVSTVKWFAESVFDGPMIEDETFVWDDLPAVGEEPINVPPAVHDSHHFIKEE